MKESEFDRIFKKHLEQLSGDITSNVNPEDVARDC